MKSFFNSNQNDILICKIYRNPSNNNKAKYNFLYSMNGIKTNKIMFIHRMFYYSRKALYNTHKKILFYYLVIAKI